MDKGYQIKNLIRFGLITLILAVLAIPSEIFAAASYVGNPPASISIDPAQQVVDGQNTITEVLTVGNFTNSTTIDDVTFRVERNGTITVGPLSLGSTFTENFEAFTPLGGGNGFRISVSHDGVSQLSLTIDLRPDENGNIDINGYSIADFEFRINGTDGGGGPVIPAGDKQGVLVDQQLVNQSNQFENQSRGREGVSQGATQEFTHSGDGDLAFNIDLGGGIGGNGGSSPWSDTVTFDVAAGIYNPQDINITNFPTEIPYGPAQEVRVQCHAGAGDVLYSETLYADGVQQTQTTDQAACVQIAGEVGEAIFSTQNDLAAYPTVDLVRFQVEQNSYGSLINDTEDSIDPGADNQPPSVTIDASIQYPAGTNRTVEQLLLDANIIIDDPDESLGLDSLTINGEAIDQIPDFNFEASDQYTLNIFATDSGGLTSPTVQLVAITELTELTVIGTIPVDQTPGVSERPRLEWSLQDGSGEVSNEALEQAPYNLQGDIEYMISTSVVPSPVVGANDCRSTPPTTLTITDSPDFTIEPDPEGPAKNFTFTDISMPYEQHIMWCVALIRREGVDTVALTEFSDSRVFTVRTESIAAPLIGTLPSTTAEEPTGSTEITLVASAGEQGAGANFYRVEGQSLIPLNVSPVPYDPQSGIATMAYEINIDLIQQQGNQMDFQATTVRDLGIPGEEEEGPLSFAVRLYFDNSLLLPAPKMEAVVPGEESNGELRIFDIPLEAETIEIWRRVANETCDPGTQECWKGNTPFERIRSFEKSALGSEPEVSSITSTSFVFLETDFAQINPDVGGTDYGISYFASVRSSDATSLRSNSVSKQDDKTMEGLPLGDPVLVADPSGFKATFFINNSSGFPENSADWVTQIQQVEVPATTACSTVSFDGLAPSVQGAIDSLSRTNDPSRNLSNAIETLEISTIPNVKSCVNVCVSDLANPETLRCFEGQVIAEDLTPADFDGLVNLVPAETGTGAIGSWNAIVDSPLEPTEFLEAQLSVTENFHPDGSPDFSGVNPVIIEDVSQTSAVFENLRTGVKVAAKVEVLDEGGNKSGGDVVLTANLFDNSPQIVDARLEVCDNCQPWQKVLNVAVQDRNQGETVSVVGFAVVGATSGGDDQVISQSLQEDIIEGNQLQNIIFPLAGTSGPLNSLAVDGFSQGLELSLGLDLSAYLTAEELDQQDFMVIVEDSSGLKGSFNTLSGLEGDFARSNNVGRASSSSGCLFGATRPGHSSSPWGVIVVGLMALMFYRRLRSV